MNAPETPPELSLLLADDQRLFVESLKYVLESTDPGIRVAAIAQDGAQALRLAEIHKPDLILMDVRMPNVDGVEATRRILEAKAQARDLPKIIMLTTFVDDDYARLALGYGAKGYLLKNMRPAELIAAIRAVAAGSTIIDGSMSQPLWREPLLNQSSSNQDKADALPNGGSAPGGKSGPLDCLSPREREVVSLVARSKGNREIAVELGLSEQTVRNYMSAIYFKLGVSDRFELLRLAGTFVPEE